jgi:hypothetical protein
LGPLPLLAYGRPPFNPSIKKDRLVNRGQLF